MSGERECSPSREHARPRVALSTLVKNGRVGASGSSDTVSETDRFSETGGGGSIVVTSSTASILSSPFLSAYCAAKAACDQLVKVAADEVGQFGIRGFWLL